MNIQRAVVMLIACCMCGSYVNAQSAHRRTRARPAMWTALQLTDSQKASVDAIHKKYLPAMKVAKKQSGDSGSRVFQKEMSEVRTLLTLSQRDMFDTYMNSDGMRMRHAYVTKMTPVRIAVPH